MISPYDGVLENSGELLILKNFHSLPTTSPHYRGQKEIPNEIEKTLSDRFEKLQEMVEPESQFKKKKIQYHKVLWLSLADCVSRVVNILPLLVRYFEEEQAEDTQNIVADRTKCRDLHDQLSMPDFQLYLYFLNPHLMLLSNVNNGYRVIT